jgi:hypothetical protein
MVDLASDPCVRLLSRGLHRHLHLACALLSPSRGGSNAWIVVPRDCLTRRWKGALDDQAAMRTPCTQVDARRGDQRAWTRDGVRAMRTDEELLKEGDCLSVSLIDFRYQAYRRARNPPERPRQRRAWRGASSHDVRMTSSGQMDRGASPSGDRREQSRRNDEAWSPLDCAPINKSFQAARHALPSALLWVGARHRSSPVRGRRSPRLRSVWRAAATCGGRVRDEGNHASPRPF